VQAFLHQETVTHLAEAFTVDVCPHFLAAAVPNGRYVEHVPQLGAITRTEMTVENGYAAPPESPGPGIDWDRDAMDDRRVSRTRKTRTSPGHSKEWPGEVRGNSDLVDLVPGDPGRDQQRAGTFGERRAETVRHEIADHEPERAPVRAAGDHPVAVPFTGKRADRDTCPKRVPYRSPKQPGGAKSLTAGRGRPSDRTGKRQRRPKPPISFA
jgi:hypothetical protein